MSLAIQCASCGHHYTVDPTLLGKRVQCSKCGTHFRVEAVAPPADQPPPPPPLDGGVRPPLAGAPPIAGAASASLAAPGRGSGPLGNEAPPVSGAASSAWSSGVAAPCSAATIERVYKLFVRGCMVALLAIVAWGVLTMVMPRPTIAARATHSLKNAEPEEGAGRALMNTVGEIVVTVASLAMTLSLVFVVAVHVLLLHMLWQQVQDAHARANPDAAVAYLFLPGFQIYWSLVAYVGLARTLNAFAERHAVTAPRADVQLMKNFLILAYVPLALYPLQVLMQGIVRAIAPDGLWVVLLLFGVLMAVAGLLAAPAWFLATRSAKDAAVTIARHRAG